MDNLLKRQPVSVARFTINSCEECAVSGEFTLPDYCPDIAMILKCILTPYVQNRQWSGEQLLVDSMVNARILYLDEGRRAIRSVEFSLPSACALRTNGRVDMSPVEVKLRAKYANCRAISPRRLEVRGAITVTASAEAVCQQEIAMAESTDGLYVKCCSLENTYPMGMSEKILTISEAVEFPESLPPAEMLLGGECRAVIRECKLLIGKAIVKGQIYVHQLYTDDMDNGTTHCLDFVLPFSQILDIDGVEEGLPYWAGVQILSDIERCTVGPDGENTILDISIKLLVQLQVFTCQKFDVLTDAFHTDYPITLESDRIHLRKFTGCRWENTVLPMQVNLPAGQLSEVVDVWILTQDNDVSCQNGIATLNGRLMICLLGRDRDGQITYLEYPEDYRLEYVCDSNAAIATPVITELRYRVISEQLELQVGMCVELRMACVSEHCIQQNLQLNTETPYVKHRATAILYYAHANENVWDIARQCHTSPDCICQENALNDDVVHQSSIVMVPIVS